MKLNLGIMITTKCNQACPHCLFFCSPKNKKASDLNIEKAVSFIETVPKDVVINEICIYGGEPTLSYDRMKKLIKKLPHAKRIQILVNGYFENESEVKKFENFCRWFNKKNYLIKISSDIFHDKFQDKNLINKLIRKYPQVVWKRRENPGEFIKMGRWKKHPTISVKPPNCTLERETIIIQQDGKINFCCGGYSAAIGTTDESFREIIKRRHAFLRFLKKRVGKITPDICKNCRRYFAEYYKKPLDTRWGP